jgi:hypothetical protein
MNEELILREAVATAWSVYLATHGDIDAADQRICSLSSPLLASANPQACVSMWVGL